MQFIVDRMPYILSAIVMVTLSLLEFFFKDKKIKTLFLISVLFCFYILVVFRGSSVGIDTNTYIKSYNQLTESKSVLSFVWDKKPEVLFYGFMALFSKIFPYKEIVFRIVYYLAICIFLFFSFYKQTRSVTKLSLFMFLGFWNIAFSGIRQAFAISLITFALSVLLFSTLKTSMKNIIYFVLNILAIGFHETSIVALLVPFLINIKLNKKTFICIFPILLFVPSIFSNLMVYASTLFYVHYNLTSSRISYTFIVILILMFLYYICVNKCFLRDKKSILEQNLKFEYNELSNQVIWIVFYILIFMSCNVFSLVVPRFALFFYFCLSVFICYFIDAFKNKKYEFASNLTILVIFAFFYISKLGELGLIPYKFL